MLQLSFVNYVKGSYLVIEGKSKSDRFYIIQCGHVKCQTSNSSINVTRSILGPGDFVGVIPCMCGRSQIETVIAMTDVVVISVRYDQYPELITRNTPVAMKIIRTFANYMREMNSTLTQLTLKNAVSETAEQLFDVASYYDKTNKPSIAIYAYYQYLKACPQGENSLTAKKRFIALKPKASAVYFEPTPDLIRYYPMDTMIFSECQRGAEMFIIQDGKVKITKVVNGEEVILAVLKKGDMFGEMALLENKPRSASAIVVEDCHLMTVNRQNFDKMVSTQAQLISRLTTMLAERLWSMYRQIANAQIIDPLYKLLDMLALQIEKSKIAINPKMTYFTDLTLQDVANMCGIPKNKQIEALCKLQIDPHIKMQGSKITILDCEELLKDVALHRRSTNNR